MSDPFVGEIRMVGFNWPPRDWAKCDGALININDNQILYSILGTQFGGDGRTNFKLPDMRGRTPIHASPSSGVLPGYFGGTESTALSEANLPSHTHTLMASSVTGTLKKPDDQTLACGTEIYADANNLTALNAAAVSNAGGGQPHPNMQPTEVVNFIIALDGLYPHRP